MNFFMYVLGVAGRDPPRAGVLVTPRRRASAAGSAGSAGSAGTRPFCLPNAVALVARGDPEGRARTDARCLSTRRSMIAKDFAFRGILTAYKLSEFHDHGRAGCRRGRAARLSRPPGRKGHARARCEYGRRLSWRLCPPCPLSTAAGATKTDARSTTVTHATASASRRGRPSAAMRSDVSESVGSARTRRFSRADVSACAGPKHQRRSAGPGRAECAGGRGSPRTLGFERQL